MRRQLLLLLAISFTLHSFGQSATETKVASRVSELTKAMIDGDSALLHSLTFANISYGHSGGLIENRAQFIERIISGKSDFVSLDATEQTILVSGKTAIVRHILKGKTNDSGKPGEIHLKIIQVWQKTHGKWKMLARQAVKMT